MEENNRSSELDELLSQPELLEDNAAPNQNAAAIRQYLSTENRRKKHRSSGTMAGRQTIILAILLSVLLVGGILYFTVLKPLIAAKQQEKQNAQNNPSWQAEQVEPDTSRGESSTANGTLTMFAPINSDNIEELAVQNENASWSYVYDDINEIFYVKDYKKTFSICDGTAWVTFANQFGTAQARTRVEDGSSPIDYAKYGLGENDVTRSCTITTRDGHTRTVTLGSQTATANGYYATASYDGVRREAVYIVSSTMARCCEMTMFDLMNPMVVLPFDEQDYVPDRLVIRHEGESFVDIRQYTGTEAVAQEIAKTVRVTTGNGLEYNVSVNYSTMLYDVLRKGINGTRVVAVSRDDEELTAEELAEWGIDLSNQAPYIDLFVSKKGMIDQTLMFSPRTEQGSYYVYVLLFDMVVEMDAKAMEFIEWDEKDFIEASIYLMSIYNITDMTVDSTALPDAYVASGIPRVKETFSMTSYRTTAADGSDTYLLDEVKVASTGMDIPDPKDSKLDGIANFKHYYMVLMTIGAQLDVPADILEHLDMNKPDVTITFHTVRKQEHVLRFYFYNSRHAYYTLDGEGQFYVVYDELTKFLADTVSVVNGVYVDWESKSNSDVKVDPESGNAEIKPTEKKEQTEEEGKLPRSVVIVIVVVAVLVVGCVGGFGIYAAVQRKKKENEAADE